MSTVSVSAPGSGGGPPICPGVADRRGATAGCRTPECSSYVARATRCGWCCASVSDSTGATQASVPSNSAVHSSRVRWANTSAKPGAQHRPAGHVVLGRQVGVGEPEQPQQLGVELGFQRADGHVPAVGGRVDVVERGPAVEEVAAALGTPGPGGQQPGEHAW